MQQSSMPYGDYTVTSVKEKMDVVAIHQWLSSESYWAKNIPFETVQTAFEHSFTVGVLLHDKQIGYARLITDYATFAYLADVYVLAQYRGQGLSKAMLEFMLAQQWTTRLRKIALATLDAHALYSQFGFTTLAMPERMMERIGITSY